MKPFITGLSLCIAASLTASAKTPLLIAHRGASHLAPENTLAAFKLAWEENADGIEGDFYLSTDGEIVCFHDKDTRRITGVSGEIEKLSWAEISKLDAGAWKSPAYRGEKIPRLGDVLDMLPPGKLFFVEIKDGPEIVGPIRKLFAEKKADPKQVILIAFSEDVIRECRRQMPEYQAHWLSALKDIEKEGQAASYLRDLEATGAQGLQFSWKAAVTPEWIRTVKEKNYSLTSWTVDEPEVARRMIGLGVDHITTDRPAGLRAELDLPEKNWNVRDHIKLEDFVIQSHRGAGELGPENSREAFELAWSLGTIPEADLRTTTDGVIVAFHDKDFSRILPHESAEIRKKGIEHLSWAEVAKLDIGVWKGERFKGQRVPDLAGIFDLLKADPKRKIYVDIKNIDLEQLAREAQAAGLASRLILASTVPDIIRRWKTLAPDSATLHWMGGDEATLAKRLEKLAAENFQGIDQLQIHVKGSLSDLMPSEVFLRKTGEELRSRQILFQTLPWQSKEEALFIKLLDLGCASFATDHPDVAAAAVRHYYDQAKD